MHDDLPVHPISSDTFHCAGSGFDPSPTFSTASTDRTSRLENMARASRKPFFAASFMEGAATMIDLESMGRDR